MELSKFERSVIEVMIQGDPEEAVLREQLHHAVVIERDYTGIGLYVKLQVAEAVLPAKLSNRYIESTPMAFLKHPALDSGAQAMLWFKDARMNTLECVTLAGEWPSDESQFVAEPYAIPGS